MDIGSLTHVGHHRKANEDNLAVDAERGVFVVADGMGGHAGGAMASAIACKIIPSGLELGRDLRQAILDAHRVIQEHPISQESPPDRAPGTTAVVAQVVGEGQVNVAWLGDSRIYLWTKRDGRERLEQVSKDHSLVQYLVDQGAITEEQARYHPHRNIILQALGMYTPDELAPETRSLALQPGDRLLLCTDGLNGELEDRLIGDILGNTQRTAQQVCEELVEETLAAGAHDNVTVVVIGV